MKKFNNIDLSEKDGSITNVIQNNLPTLNNCTSVKELSSKLSILFSDNKINTPASKRLLANVSSKKDFVSALSTVYNSVLYGSTLGVIK